MSKIDYFPPSSQLLSYTLLKSLNELKNDIETKLQMLESNDLSIYIATYKIYEETADFKNKINEIKEQREALLNSLEGGSSNSFILNDLDQKIATLEEELSYKICHMNQEKIKHQKNTEKLIHDLDTHLEAMKPQIEKLERELEIEKAVARQSQLSLIEEDYVKALLELKDNLLKYEKMQLNYWKIENSEQLLGAMLEKQGLTFTSSGEILTENGSRISFRTAENRGLFRALNEAANNKIVAFVKHREDDESTRSSESSTTITSIGASEDIKYLKHTVGRALTLALAEIVAKHPSDPIHYLGHYLFKYRYNQEIEQVQKDEVDELTKERNKLAQIRWHQFVQEEARNAVIDMVIRAEEIIYQKELKRIEEEMIAAQEHEENEEAEEDALLQEEARDVFE